VEVDNKTKWTTIFLGRLFFATDLTRSLPVRIPPHMMMITFQTKNHLTIGFVHSAPKLLRRFTRCNHQDKAFQKSSKLYFHDQPIF
jgi:hypothetical protein